MYGVMEEIENVLLKLLHFCLNIDNLESDSRILSENRSIERYGSMKMQNFYNNSLSSQFFGNRSEFTELG